MLSSEEGGVWMSRRSPPPKQVRALPETSPCQQQSLHASSLLHCPSPLGTPSSIRELRYPWAVPHPDGVELIPPASGGWIHFFFWRGFLCTFFLIDPFYDYFPRRCCTPPPQLLHPRRCCTPADAAGVIGCNGLEIQLVHRGPAWTPEAPHQTQGYQPTNSPLGSPQGQASAMGYSGHRGPALPLPVCEAPQAQQHGQFTTSQATLHDAPRIG